MERPSMTRGGDAVDRLAEAIRLNRKGNWPAIYLAMGAVGPDDLRSDAAYRSSHPGRVSMTGFYAEACGRAGMAMSQLRAIQRAGRFYERAASESERLPPIGSQPVAGISPQTIALVAQASRLAARGGEGPSEGELGAELLERIIAGEGPTRKELSALVRSLTPMTARTCPPDSLGSAKEGAMLAVEAVHALERGGWLAALYGGEGADRPLVGRVKVVQGLRRDALAVEDASGDLAFHTFSFLTRGMPAFPDVGASGEDYMWAVAPASFAERQPRLPGEAGLLLLGDGRLQVASLPRRLHPGLEERIALRDALIAENLGPRKTLTRIP